MQKFHSAKYIIDPYTNETDHVSIVLREDSGRLIIAPINLENYWYAELMEAVEAGELTIADADPIPTP